MSFSSLRHHQYSPAYAALRPMILRYNSKRELVIQMSSGRIVCIFTYSSVRVYVYGLPWERRYWKDMPQYNIERVFDALYKILDQEHVFASICDSDNSIRKSDVFSICLNLIRTCVALPFSLLPNPRNVFVRQPTGCDGLDIIPGIKHIAQPMSSHSRAWAAYYLLKCEASSSGSSLTIPEVSLLDIGHPKGYNSLSDKEIYLFHVACGLAYVYSDYVFHNLYDTIDILQTGRVTDFSLPATAYSKKSIRAEDEIPTASGSLGVVDNVPPSFRCSCVAISLPISPSVDEAQEDGPSNAAVTQPEFLWDNQSVITYSYMGGHSFQHYKVDVIAQEWTWYTNIRFRKIKSDGMIRISFDPSSGTWSYVGRQCEKVDGDEATMNLGSIKPTTMTPSLDEKRVILHEFGHALGLLHEHQSPSRLGVLTLNEMATKQYYKARLHWSSSRVEKQVLHVYDEHDVGSYSEIDFSSIMIYSMSYTLSAEGVDITEQFNLSDMDKAYIFLNYPRAIAHVNTPEWTIRKALKVAGVTGRRRTDILNASTPDSIRNFFIQWNVENRVKSLSAI